MDAYERRRLAQEEAENTLSSMIEKCRKYLPDPDFYEPRCIRIPYQPPFSPIMTAKTVPNPLLDKMYEVAFYRSPVYNEDNELIRFEWLFDNFY